VEPGGEADGGGVGGVVDQFVDPVQDGEEVVGGVVAALGFGPAGEEVLAVRRWGRMAGGLAGAVEVYGPAGEERVVGWVAGCGVGHGPIVWGEGVGARGVWQAVQHV
jgi:hypothetical protein